MDVIWHSVPQQVDGMALSVAANPGVVIMIRTVGGVDAQDSFLTPDEARIEARALLEGADHAEDAA